jgi:hypothetical protein
MTQRTLSAIIFTMIFSLASTTLIAGGHTAENAPAKSSKEVKTQGSTEHTDATKKLPVSQESHPKAPHGKTHAPQMEELPHIHKFHKERVKKIKKHHSKYWLLSQVIIVLCHLSILVIGYLHATH